MQTGKRIFKNTLFLIVGKGFGDLATFLFLVYFARVFGISIFGQYALAMSLGGFLSILVSLGLNTLVIREISKDKNNDARYIGNMLATQCVLAILCWGLIGIFILLSNFDNDAGLIILIIGTYQVLYKLTELIHSRFKAHEDMEYSALLEIYHKIVILIFGSLCIILVKDPVITLLVYPVSAASMFLIGIIISNHKYGNPGFKINFSFIRELLSKAMPFLILTILVQFYDRIGIILLTTFQGDEATGIYAASDRFLIAIISGIGLFGSALFPVMSKFAHESRQKLTVTYERSVRIIMVTVLPTSTFLYLFSDQIILFVYGEAFSESASIFRILSWAILPIGLCVILANLLVAIDQQKNIAKTELLIFSGFLIACIILIPLYSYTGLAYAKLVTSSVLCLAFSWQLSKTFRQNLLVRTIKSPLIASLTTIFVFNLMSDQNLWLSFPIALLTCIITLFLTGGIKSHDLSYIKDNLLEKR